MMFGWSGSAVVGGFLIDSYGFRITFLITAAMQSVSLVFLVALLPVVRSCLSAYKDINTQDSILQPQTTVMRSAICQPSAS